MKMDNSLDILSDKDVEVLFAAFPDLKQRFSGKNEKEEILSYMDKQAKEYNVRYGASQVLEYTAVVAAMKLRAKIALGELKKEDISGLAPELHDKVLNGAEIFKNTPEKTPSVNRDLCRDIRDMDFNKAIAVLPLQDELSRQFGEEKLVSDDAEQWLMRKDAYKFINLTMISGNETGGGRGLEADEFTKTIGRRLINGAVEKGDDNDIFKTFAALSQTANALQAHAAVELGNTFPEYAGKFEKNECFFRGHEMETLAVCHACAENNLRFEDMEQLKKTIKTSAAKDFAYGSYAPVFEIYADVADVEKGMCKISRGENSEVCLPKDFPKTREAEDFVRSVKMAAVSNNFLRGRNNAAMREGA